MMQQFNVSLTDRTQRRWSGTTRGPEIDAAPPSPSAGHHPPSLPRQAALPGSNATAFAPPRSDFSFSRTQPEINQLFACIQSMTAAAQSPRGEIKYFLDAQRNYEMSVMAGQLAKRLESYCEDPAYEPEEETVDELRKLSFFMTQEEVEKIIDSALTENNHGRLKTKLVGAAIAGHPEMAQALADTVCLLDTQDTKGVPQEQANRWERSSVLADIFGSVGSAAEPGVYLPFVKLLRSGQYMADQHIATKMARSLPDLPTQVADQVALFVLGQQPAGLPEKPSYEHTLQIFYQLKNVSPVVRNAAFVKASDIYNLTSSEDQKEFMAEDFPMEDIFSSQAKFELSDETKKKWRDLFRGCPAV